MIKNHRQVEPVENSEISTCCLQGSCSAAELNGHKQAEVIPNKKYILQTFVLQNLQQILLYYIHGRLSISQLDLYFSNGLIAVILVRHPNSIDYHAEDQYLETFTELQHYLIYLMSNQHNDLRLLAPTPFLQFGYPRSSQSSYFENTKTVSFSRCYLTVGRITALPLIEPNGMVYYIQLCFAHYT